MKLLLSLGALLAVLCLAAGHSWDANSVNDPATWSFDHGTNSDAYSKKFEYNLAKLPLSAEILPHPWSETYWASCESGIAHRWAKYPSNDFHYHLYTLEELQKMSTDDVKTLSPAEKFDIFQQRYDYPTVKSEWSRTSPSDASWEGICHGWAPAAYSYIQPNSLTMTNPDGIKLPFASSDIKGLLSYYAAEYQRSSANDWMASRCNEDLHAHPTLENQSECLDMNAGTMHVLFANMLGLRKQALVIDVTRDLQVWNQPLYQYRSTISPVVNNSVAVQTTITYTKETGPEWDSHDNYGYSQTYEYTLELDESGNITGGSMQTWNRPDFAWNLHIRHFHGYFFALETIYRAAINGSDATDDVPIVGATSPLAWMDDVSILRTFLKNAVNAFGRISYGRGHHERWLVTPPNATAVEISFTHLDTERYHDKVKIYEHSHCEGALVAVIHGNVAPRPIVVNTPSACVIFESDPFGSTPGAGFKAVARAI